jgi:hypothetical protein
MSLHRHLVALLPLTSAALILPAPASALWVIDIDGTTAVAWGEFKDGIWSGRHFSTPPITTLRITDLYGDIEPDAFYGNPGENPGVRLTHLGRDGANGRNLPLYGEDGGNGVGGLGLRIDFVGPWYDAGGWNQEGGIWTQLWFNHGIVSQSVGGNGGNGGEGYGAIYTPGGDGGDGGQGGAVTVNVSLPADNWNGVWTSGKGAQGVLALSQGGDGGDGGDGYGAGVAKGGDGGRGGSGGAVDLAVNFGVGTGGDQANALLAQSLGGESGYGGAGGGIFGGGGAGSDSGKGGPVSVTTSDAGIGTYGQESHGILAQSIGGFARGAGTGGGLVAWGGSGASSGDGGTVTVTNGGLIETKGSGSHAIFGQSIGGGGGNAGIGGGVVAFGGSGSAGGDGKTVTIRNHGRLRTHAENAVGIVGQSIGGGGGAGEGAGGLVSVGGSGDSNGDGGTVDVANAARIQTSGHYSSSIFAQSVGGGGGRARTSGTALLSFGGDGAAGGSGGAVMVDNTGPLETSGLDSSAIFAQSLGGGGGAGGSVQGYGVVNVIYGGTSSTGGQGGPVTVHSGPTSVSTAGDFSRGIHAQSLGGGGGSGGNVHSYVGGPQVSVTEAFGGRGGGGGAGGQVDLSSASSIGTRGRHGHGLYAQSVGGGGGAGGSTVTWSATVGDLIKGAPSLSLAFSIGGSGGRGGDGGVVDLSSTGDVSTTGFRSYGAFAQSVGGGGGDGGNSTAAVLAFDALGWALAIGGTGSAAGSGGAVSVSSSGALTTAGDLAYGVLAQSVGGGGGAGGHTTTLAVDAGIIPHLDDLLIVPDYLASNSVGGWGSGGGGGGAVDVASTGGITTRGGFAHAILAQSVGGGGGSGGDATTTEITLGVDLSEAFQSLGVTSDVVLGGRGGAGGNGALVAVRNDGDVVTEGHFANGVLAQSVGGGGGTHGTRISDEYSVINPLGSSVVLRGGSANHGDGGDVSVENRADITTGGVFSHGILAQSVGGGGGYAGISETLHISSLQLGAGGTGVSAANTGYGVGFAGSTGGAGSAGAVSVTHTGRITTSGESSHGILAQSAARTGTAGPVTVTLASRILASGVDSDGVHAQSVGGGGNISVNNGGEVQGGSGAGAGVRIDGGANNTLTNARGGHISALSGQAVVASSGDDTVVNQGTVVGTVALGGGTNAFLNASGARLDAGPTIDLGVGNALMNDGTLSPGGRGTVLTTTLIGDLAQSGLGTLEIDVGGFSPGLFDALDVTGTLTGATGSASALAAGGQVQFSLLAGYDIWADLAAGRSLALRFLEVADHPEPLSASLFSYEFLGMPSGVQLDVLARGGGLYLEASRVPLPPAAWLFAAALAGLGGARRRS